MLMNYFISLSTLIDVILAIKPFHGCDYFQNVEVGKSYDIFSPEYSQNGESNREVMECRWDAMAPAGYILILECEVYLPLSDDCNEGRIEVSASGKLDLEDADRYCGTQPFQTESVGNRMVIALKRAKTYEGKFKCHVYLKPDITFPCECGHRKRNRIVGGVQTLVNEFPMVGGLTLKNLPYVFCGATIIAQSFAITAAHCLRRKNLNYMALLVGDHNYRTADETRYAALYKLSKVQIHPEYDPVENKNDMALIQTQYAMQFNEAVGAVCLPFRHVDSFEKFNNKIVEAVGWGASEFAGPPSPFLQKVKLNVISNSQCSEAYPEEISSDQLCTYSYDKDTCQSDSGGPLLYTEPSNNLLYLVGVVSYGRGCATENPGVSARVTSYMEWIQLNTPNVRYCVK
ncbi:Venom serine protease 34 [Pseudolycoriella hygida]|uniref:Venom serine protease 34 n=1 Tax=Pseudolycoriella hygida TaxID=35572 RepID=A0A9Q0NCN7_9DIPT|nr:Venom serine protease 34 [Pseudolycoriella hygida]